MYTTTWGFGDLAISDSESFSETNVMYVRKFIEAVLEYTGAEKVDVIAHSMGGILSRRAIKGGTVTNDLETFTVGASLGNYVDTYLAIASPYYGIIDCTYSGL